MYIQTNEGAWWVQPLRLLYIFSKLKLNRIKHKNDTCTIPNVDNTKFTTLDVVPQNN